MKNTNPLDVISEALDKMPKEEQEEFRGVIGRLIRSGSNTLTEAVKRKLLEKR